MNQLYLGKECKNPKCLIFSLTINLNKTIIKEATLPDGTIGFQGKGRGKPIKIIQSFD
jgi:hypothetical protein